MVNYTDPEALCSGNMAGISPEAESIPTLPRRNRGLACSGNRRQNRAPFLSPMLVIRRPTNLCVCVHRASSNFSLLFSLNGNTQWKIDDHFENCFIYDGKKTHWECSYTRRCLVTNNCSVLALFLILYWYHLNRSPRIPAIFSNLFGFFFLTM